MCVCFIFESDIVWVNEQLKILSMVNVKTH